jgi:hypothetical protein
VNKIEGKEKIEGKTKKTIKKRRRVMSLHKGEEELQQLPLFLPIPTTTTPLKATVHDCTITAKSVSPPPPPPSSSMSSRPPPFCK